MAAREGCCEHLWKMEKNPHAEYAVTSMEVWSHNVGIEILREIYKEECNFNWIDPESTVLKKASPRWLLAMCDGILSFVEAKQRGY